MGKQSPKKFCEDCTHHSEKELCTVPVPTWTHYYTQDYDDQEYIAFIPGKTLADRCPLFKQFQEVIEEDTAV